MPLKPHALFQIDEWTLFENQDFQDLCLYIEALAPNVCLAFLHFDARQKTETSKYSVVEGSV